MNIIVALALFIVGTFLGNSIAISALIHPLLYKLAPETHRSVAAAIAAVYAKVLPVWYSCSLLLLIAVSVTSHSVLVILGTLIFFTTLVVTLVWLAPMNGRIAKWDLISPPPDWLKQRKRWDLGHFWRTVGVAVSFALFCYAVALGSAGM